jgi:DNA-binding FadR family transcriptional regulator
MSTSGINFDASQMSAVSGASSYVPASTTTSGSTATTLIAELRNSIKQNSQDFKALKTALNSNDATGAQQAFNTLQQDIQKASSSAGGQSLFDSSSPIGKDFQAIGDALKSGDLSAAKQAFATFRQDIRKAGRAARAQGVHSAGGNDGDADDGSASAASGSASSSGTGSLLNVQA